MSDRARIKDIEMLRTIMKEQHENIQKARMLYKTASFAYSNEVVCFLRSRIPNSFTAENFYLSREHIKGTEDGIPPKPEMESKYKLITWDLQGFLGLEKEPEIVELDYCGVHSTVICFKLNNRKYSIKIPQVFDTIYNDSFLGYFNEDGYEKSAASLDIELKVNNNDNDILIKTILPDKIDTIKDVFKELRKV